MWEGKHMSKQLDCSTRIAITQNNGIHGIDYRSAHHLQQAQSCSQQAKVWVDQPLRCGLHNFNIKLFQSGDALWKLLSRIDFELGNACWIEDDLHIFRISYYRVILKVYISFLHMSHSMCTSILKPCTLHSRTVAEYTARSKWAIACGIRKISFLLERRLCQLFVHQIGTTWPLFWAISMASVSNGSVFRPFEL